MDLIRDVMKNARRFYSSVRYAYTTIPTYPCGQIGFILAIKESEDDVLADEFKEKYQKIQKNLDSARDSYEDFCQKNNLKTRQERLKVYQK